MSVKPLKVHSFLEQSKVMDNIDTERQAQALERLSKILSHRKIYAVNDHHDLQEAAAEIMEAKARLEEIQRQLHLLIKTGGTSSQLH